MTHSRSRPSATSSTEGRHNFHVPLTTVNRLLNDDRHVIKTFGNNDNNENNINNNEFVTSTTVTTSSSAAYCAIVCQTDNYLDLCKRVIAWTNASEYFVMRILRYKK